MPTGTRSVWFDGAAPALDVGRPLPPRTWDLVVIGGGIIGLLSALRARERGLDVCVLEADRIGEGTTAHSTVKVTSGHGSITAQLARQHGMARAIAYQQANDSGFAALRDLVTRLTEPVDWTIAEHVVHASSASAVEDLRRTEEVGRAAGSAVVGASPPSWVRGEALAWTDSALVNPLSLARAIGRLLASLDVPVIEGARVTSVDSDDSRVSVLLESGHVVTGRAAVVATHSPVHDPDLMTMHLAVERHAAIAVPVRGDDVPSSFGIDGLSTRPATLPDGSRGAVVVGTSHEAGALPPSAWTDLAEWALVTLHAEAPTFRWSAQDLRNPDYLPFVGRTRRHSRVIVVTGLNAWGFTNAAAMAQHIADELVGHSTYRQETAPWRMSNGLTRAALTGTLGNVWHAARTQVPAMVASVRPSASPASDLEPGEGRVVGGPFTPIAECRTPDGRLHRVSARCTHMGCSVEWNATETTWDCPCHGSRFAPDGDVVEGPAATPLAPR